MFVEVYGCGGLVLLGGILGGRGGLLMQLRKLGENKYRFLFKGSSSKVRKLLEVNRVLEIHFKNILRISQECTLYPKSIQHYV